MWQAGAGFGANRAVGDADSEVTDFFRQPGRACRRIRLSRIRWPPKAAAFRARRQSRVIFLFMYGGPSHIDTFDYKPNMVGMDGKTVDVKTFGRGGHRNQGRIVEPRWKFSSSTVECGKWVSTLFPNVAKHVDDIAFLHSMTADSPIHGSAMLMMNSGKILSGKPRARVVGQLRPRLGQREPARFRRDVGSHGRSDQRGQELEQRVHARHVMPEPCFAAMVRRF